MNQVAKTYQKGEIPAVLPIRSADCKGCDACRRCCLISAVTGSFGATHGIDVDLCLSCGQCLISCSFGAVYDDAMDKVISKLQDKNVSVVGIIAPAVRVAIGEEFGMKTGSLVTGKLYGSMKKAGFEILDNNLAAVRTAYAVLTGEELANIEFKPVRGLKGVKSAAVMLKDAKYEKRSPSNWRSSTTWRATSNRSSMTFWPARPHITSSR